MCYLCECNTKQIVALDSPWSPSRVFLAIDEVMCGFGLPTWHICSWERKWRRGEWFVHGFFEHIPPNSPTVSSPAIVLDDSCIAERDFSSSLMGKIKDINAMSNLYLILTNEGFENVKLSYLGEMLGLIEMDSIVSKEKISKHMGVRSWFSELKPACNSFVSNERIVWIFVEGFPIKAYTRNTFAKIVSQWGELTDVEDKENSILSFKSCMHGKDKPSNSNEPIDLNKSEDPFEIYKILKKKKEPEVTKSDEPQFPPGFTLEVVDENVMEFNYEKISQSKNILANNNEMDSSDQIGKTSIPKFKASGSILDVMDELIKVGQTMGYNMDGCMKNIESIIGSQGT
ncbi:hypothetical protein Tco_0655542 [Tanacetum coccineum]|uniref:RNA-directed DNA polymerase, eukaryota n=1 Tax=Tanacetum coccineum TaxID=301880 RepID=A0ABQ4X6U1_9ASTR